LMVAFEMLTVLVLRAHYTMDVFTGVVTGLYAAHLANCITARVESRRPARSSEGFKK